MRRSSDIGSVTPRVGTVAGGGTRRRYPGPVRQIAAFLVAVVMVAGCGGSSGEPPAIVYDATVAFDLRDLATTTWQDFLAAFPGRLDCFGDVTLEATVSQDERSTYDAERATVTVLVPATARQYRAALVHEFAHHVEADCPEQANLRPVFLDAQGFPQGTDWFAGETWDDTPAQHYAEAVVEYVLGERDPDRTVDVGPRAVEIVAAWAQGVVAADD